MSCLDLRLVDVVVGQLFIAVTRFLLVTVLCCLDYCGVNCLVLFVADKGKQKTDKADTEAPSGGKDMTTPTRVKIEPPLVEDILRHPIEVFVSSGEPFVHPDSK